MPRQFAKSPTQSPRLRHQSPLAHRKSIQVVSRKVYTASQDQVRRRTKIFRRAVQLTYGGEEVLEIQSYSMEKSGRIWPLPQRSQEYSSYWSPTQL